MLLLDSSGAIGGVLELPGDDYFIYGGGEVQGLSGLIRHVCTIYEEKSNLKKDVIAPRTEGASRALSGRGAWAPRSPHLLSLV